MRHHPRLDNNQREIVAALLGVGASVQSLSSVGMGCPDLLVGFRGRDYLGEVKSAKGKLTPAQKEWLRNWKGEWAVWRTPEDALRTIGAIK